MSEFMNVTDLPDAWLDAMRNYVSNIYDMLNGLPAPLGFLIIQNLLNNYIYNKASKESRSMLIESVVESFNRSVKNWDEEEKTIQDEGTIGINSRYSLKHMKKQTDMGYAPYIRIGMNDEKSIKGVAEFFKVGKYYPEKSYNGYRAMHRWDCRNTKDTKMVLTMLEPFLRLKKSQAQLALRFINECMRPKSVRIGIPFTEKLVAKRWDFYIQMKILNGVDVSEYSPATTKRMGRPKSIRVSSDSLNS